MKSTRALRRGRTLLLGLFAACSLATLSQASAETGTWASTRGPEGGTVYAVAVDPASSRVIYAATAEGVFKSTDAGGSWRHTGAPTDNWIAGALAVDRRAPGTVYTGTSSGVVRSLDGGGTWTPAAAGLPSGGIWALALDPVNRRTLYAASWEDGIYKTTDAGAVWRRIGGGMKRLDEVRAIVVDPRAPRTVYAGGSDGVLRTTDGGATWRPTRLTSQVNALALDGARPARLYAGTEDGCARSKNRGLAWTSCGKALERFEVQSLAVDPTNPKIVYAGTYELFTDERPRGSLYVTSDAGRTWKSASRGLLGFVIDSIAVPQAPRATLYAGSSGGGLFKTVNRGRSWAAANSGLVATWIEDLAVDPRRPDTLYAGTFRSGVFAGTGSGATWRSGRGLELGFRRNVDAIAVDSSSSIVYAGTWDGLFRSTDGGTSWMRPAAGFDDEWVGALAVDPRAPGVVYAGLTVIDGGVLRSTDGGTTWAPASSGLPLDDGDPPGIDALAVDPSSGAVLAAVQVGFLRGRVFRSTDSGRTWRAAGSGLTTDSLLTLAFDPLEPGTVYAGTYSKGVFKSIDGGETWTPAGAVPGEGFVPSIVVDPVRAATLYAATESGVVRSGDGGTSWQALDAGLTSYAQALAIDPLGTVLYAGTAAGGVYRCELGPPA